jgi:opacity protein-like surface antigen
VSTLALALLLAAAPADRATPATDDAVTITDDAVVPADTAATTPDADPPTTPPDAATTRPADTAEVGVVETKPEDPTVFPDPRKFSRGFFVEAGVGPGIPIGRTARVLSTGFAFSARVGYEIRRWVALQLHATGMISRFDDGNLRRELLGQGVYTGEARLGVPFRRFLISVHGGAGLAQTSNNLLQVARIADDNRRFGLAWDAGLSFDVHSLNRHFSGGFAGTFIGTPALANSGTLLIQLYLRYTH